MDDMPTDTWWNLDEIKRSQIISATLHEFATHQYDDASLSAIVKQLGIAKGSMYQYFADKQELYQFILQYAYDTMHTQIAAHMPIQLLAHADMFAVLRGHMDALSMVALHHPQVIQLIHRSIAETHAVSHIARTLYERHQRTFAESLVYTAREDRSLRDDVDPAVVIFLVSAVVHAFMSMPVAQYSRTFTEQLIRMLDQGLRYRLR